MPSRPRALTQHEALLLLRRLERLEAGARDLALDLAAGAAARVFLFEGRELCGWGWQSGERETEQRTCKGERAPSRARETRDRAHTAITRAHALASRKGARGGITHPTHVPERQRYGTSTPAASAASSSTVSGAQLCVFSCGGGGVWWM